MQIFQNYFQVANLSNHIVNNKILGVLILNWYSWGRETKMGGKHRENVDKFTENFFVDEHQ